MVEASAGADRHQQPGRYGVAGDPDLAVAGQPGLVGDLAGAAQSGTAQSSAQLVDHRITRRVDPLPERDYRRGAAQLAHIGVVALN